MSDQPGKEEPRLDGPSGRILDANLAALMRVYVPVLPRPELRRELLELAVAEAGRHGSGLDTGTVRGPRRLWVYALPLAAAAALLLWLGAQLFGGAGAGEAGRGEPSLADGGGASSAPRLDQPADGDSVGAGESEGVEIQEPADLLASGERRPVDPDGGDNGAEPDAGASQGEPEAAPDGATLAGTVSGPDGEPVAAFRVMLLADREVPNVLEPDVLAFETTDGAFRWDGVAAGRYEVFVEADGLAQHRLGPIDLDARSAHSIEVELKRGRELVGWVVAADTETPIAGAEVVVETETPSKLLPLELAADPDWLRPLARTGADGGFTLKDIGAGEHRLRVNAPGFAPTWVSAGVSTEPTIVRLGRGGGVRGVVTDGLGQPREGAVLLASFGDDPSNSQFMSNSRLFSYDQGVTDERGEYSFEHLAPGFYMLIQWPDNASFMRGDSPTLKPAMVGPGKTVTVDFRADRNVYVLNGRVLDAEGAPKSLLKLTLLPDEANEIKQVDAWQASSTDEEGRFRFEVATHGRYYLYATHGMGEQLELIHALEILEGEPEQDVEVTLARTTIAVEVLRAADDTPVHGASVIFVRVTGPQSSEFAGRSLADENGRAELRGLPPGRYIAIGMDVIVGDLGQAASDLIELEAAPASPTGADRPADAVLRLPVGGSVRLRVVRPDGTPIPAASAGIREEGGGSIDNFFEPIADKDGRIVLPGLAPGGYIVHASADGFGRAESVVEVRAVVGADLTLTLQPND